MAAGFAVKAQPALNSMTERKNSKLFCRINGYLGQHRMQYHKEFFWKLCFVMRFSLVTVYTRLIFALLDNFLAKTRGYKIYASNFWKALF
jgi:cytochrome c biogenesis protein CcdA